MMSFLILLYLLTSSSFSLTYFFLKSFVSTFFLLPTFKCGIALCRSHLLIILLYLMTCK